MKRIIVFALCWNYFIVLAQTKETAIGLKEVNISASFIRQFGVGGRIYTFDSTQLQRFKGLSIADLFAQNLPIYLRNYGNGMLASGTFQGASATHVAVLWEGININIPSLGQSDISLIPVSLHKIEVLYGAGSTLFGSDAMGGAISLSSNLIIQQCFTGDLQFAYGSFGNKVSSFTLKSPEFSTKKWQYSTQINVWGNWLENTFQYQNTTLSGNPYETNNHGKVQRRGIIQDVFLKNRNKNLAIDFHIWLQNADRALQPSIGGIGNESQQDYSNRVLGKLRLRNFTTKIGYITDYIGYQNPVAFINSHNSTNKWIGVVEQNNHFGFSTGKYIDVQIGFQGQLIKATIDSYGALSIGESRLDAYLLSSIRLNKHTRATFHARKNWVEKQIPTTLTPLMGIEYTWAGEKISLLAKGQVSGAFRLPTLNEKFWQPGGNQNILAEKGVYKKIDLLVGYPTSKSKPIMELSVYQNDIHDFIQWKPQKGLSYWSPNNIQEVTVQGFESTLGLEKVFSTNKFAGKINYQYTKAIISAIKLPIDTGLLGKQLIYTPSHIAMASVSLENKHWYIQLNTNYTSQRYTTSDNDHVLPAFGLVNASVNWRPLPKYSFSIKANNITSTSYQTLEGKAMPLINFQAEMIYSFNR